MKKYCTHLILCVLAVLAFSCRSTAQPLKLSSKNKKAIKWFEDANYLYQTGKTAQAAEWFTNATKEDPSFIEAWYLLGDVNADLKRYKEASEAYKKGLELSPDGFPRLYFVVGNIEKQRGEFEEAITFFEKYLKIKQKDTSLYKDTRNQILMCRNAAVIKNNPVPFNPVNLGTNINTPEAEYQPSLTADELTLVITRLVRAVPGSCPTPGGKVEDFYVSQKKPAGWGMAENMGPPLNTACNEGAQCISADGRYMFFAACERRDGLGRCDIYWSKREGSGWSIPQNLGAPVNTQHWESQPSFSVDGKTLYYISNMPGGYGKSDIWKTELQPDGTWSKPVNLGPNVNTAGDENSPFIHPDDQTLYFASSKHTGLGGLDLFFARKNPDGSFGKATNLGYPINTTGDERSLIVSANGEHAYFASNNLEGGFGDYDIYTFDLYKDARPQAVTYMKGLVTDKNTRIPLNARFELIDLESGKTIVSSFSDAATGEFLVCIPTNRNYALNVSKDGYLFSSENFSLKGTNSNKEPFRKNVELVPIEKDAPVVLKNVFFATASSALESASFVELDKLVAFLDKNPKISIQISGHTDNVGGKEYNQKLSESRAKSVFDYLTSKKINAARLSYKGFGDTKPIKPNDTEEGRAENRRTEFVVTGF